MTDPLDLSQTWLIQQTQHILSSYKKWTGKNLLSPQSLTAPVRELFYAPFVVVSSTSDADPILNYGNQKALDLWEMPWEILTRTPGRKTAEPSHQKERQKFLDVVQKNGFIDDYSGIRISTTGKRFLIEKAIVWNLVDSSNQFIGQAATFTHWKYL